MVTDVVLEEAVRLVEEGLSVTLPVSGWSMLPFIIGGRESVILSKPDQVVRGDVVLAWIPPLKPVGNSPQTEGRFVVHRIIRIEGETVTLMGDGNLVGTECCTLSDIRARVTHVVCTSSICTTEKFLLIKARRMTRRRQPTFTSQVWRL